jgi:hypothetical protein
MACACARGQCFVFEDESTESCELGIDGLGFGNLVLCIRGALTASIMIPRLNDTMWVILL